MLSTLGVLRCSFGSSDMLSLRVSKFVSTIKIFPTSGIPNIFSQNIRHFSQKSLPRTISGRSSLPTEQVERTTKNFRCLFRPLLFTFSVGCLTYGGAAIWQYEELRKMVRKESEWQHRLHSNFYNKSGSVRQKLNRWWNTLTIGERVVVSIATVNLAVFLLWRVPSLNSVMMKYFVGSPMGAAPCTSMLLSAFSHHSFFHLFANMYVLWSFTPSITNILGPEQFVATYLTAAVVSSFGSYVMKVVRGSMVPSLGASGAIMAVLGMVCMQHPDARLSIAFVDQIIPHSFSAGDGMKGLILMDVLGVLLRWKLFDHAAHLSGMFFGLWYIAYGHQLIWQNRESLVRRWHSLRNKPSSD